MAGRCALLSRADAIFLAVPITIDGWTDLGPPLAYRGAGRRFLAHTKETCKEHSLAIAVWLLCVPLLIAVVDLLQRQGHGAD